MTRVATRVGPADHGRRMSLEEFDRAEGQEGYRYELSRGIITVTDVPGLEHQAQVAATHEQFILYKSAHRGIVYRVVERGSAKILLSDLQSERHPDLFLYKSRPADRENVWSTWVPELVVEVVSPSSRHRDYEEKPEEYLRFGVSEYWIIDHAKREMLALRHDGGRWVRKTVSEDEVYETKLLPGLAFALAPIFAAADQETR
jgi:Uma2 family endonuclease